MLILVGVTVIVALNGGLFSTAKNSTLETRGAIVEEKVLEWKTNKTMDEYSENKTVQTLEELLENLEFQKLLTTEERKSVEKMGKVTIGRRTIVFEEKDISDIIKVGDYISYTPQSTQTSYEFDAMHTGYTNNQTINKEDMRWRVLNINDNTIDLISEIPIRSELYLQGALGYNNGVYLLNDFCNTLYGNPTIGATARSLNIEDIESKMDLSIWDYNNYNGGTKYGNSTIYGVNHYGGPNNTQSYPYQWSNEKTQKSKINEVLINGTLGMSEQDELTTNTSTTVDLIEVEQTYWSRNNMENNFILKDSDNIYYELLCGDGNYRYWLSSRNVNASVGPSVCYAEYGISTVFNGGISRVNLLVSTNASSVSYGNLSIRPIVSIPIDKITI